MEKSIDTAPAAAASTSVAIFAKAAELGRLIHADPRVAALEEARAAYESDPTISTLTTEYDVQQKALAAAYAESERDEALITAINNRVSEIYEQVIATEVYKAYERAQNEVSELMRQVNATIQYEVSGETPCTHDCASCGGCA